MRQLFKGILFFLFTFAVMYGIAFFVSTAVEHREHNYCTCLGHQPYINTKWTGSECLTYVYDPMDSFDGHSMVEYLYSSMEYCR